MALALNILEEYILINRKTVYTLAIPLLADSIKVSKCYNSKYVHQLFVLRM